MTSHPQKQESARAWRRRICLLAAWAGGVALAQPDPAPASRPILRIYAYHLKPPFLLDKAGRRGLYPALVALLQEHLPQWKLELSYLPRKRLDLLLEAGQLDGAVIGVSPLWFSPEVRAANAWTNALLEDADLLISLRSRPISFAGPKSLRGIRLALPRGYLVPGVNQAIAAGDIQRTEPESEVNAMAMLVRGHADAVVVTELTYRAWLLDNPSWINRLVHDVPPLGRFELGLLVPPRLAGSLQALNEAVSRTRRSRAWEALIASELGPAKEILLAPP
ncbi:polar amino acid transport system substrate-binding protein [Inhella inkyongensis]|uniref:Polar amino acid transport system substrate-binding protein n=1 Tax=Inhella inkyongensis TaxID=392593 RepID=A0A840S1W9_9BURK|nr:ABC transporter substrate-binding protein [Inhella inkyongensis]MBB5203522.1 polar amino acid transport system substrate-binding protein [Inhella inkyongensis]